MVSTFERVSNEDSQFERSTSYLSHEALANFLLELPRDAKSITTIKIDDREVEVAQFAYDALQVKKSLRVPFINFADPNF